jgi:long-chain acyl-CoA synthetase
MLDPRKPPVTLAEMAQRSFVQHADSPYLGVKNKELKQYEYSTYAQVAARVRNAAGGLLQLGLARGERAAILSENRREWAIADLACQMLGVISVPMFATLPASQVRTILEDSGAKIIFVSNAAQLKKIEAIRAELPELKSVVVSESADAVGENVLSFADLESRGQEYFAQNAGEYESIWPAAQGDDIATIIYTSGTGGEPKGVMLSHRNILSNLEAITDAIDLSSKDSFLSFLPLAHVYERTAGYYLPLRIGAPIAYCESLFTVDKNLREVEPTIMFAVPRLYESMREKIFSAADSLPENQKSKYLDALALAQKAGAAQGHLPDAPGLNLMEQIKYKVYDAKVYSKIREKFGRNFRVFVAGGAPLPPQLGALFLGIGIEILEGYGLTETSPVIGVNRPGDIRLGTVGPILDNLEVKIESDGEICVKGPSVMKGYWNKPEATREALTKDGWFHTGDIGALDGKVLRITDRKKDLLVLANGKKVAPAPIEMKLAQSPYISQVVLLGDKLKAVTALIVPNLEPLKSWTSEQGIDSENDELLLKEARVNKLFKDEIEKYSGGLADFERIKKFALVPQAFSVEGGELTPTMKVKRRVVAEKYSHLIGGTE